MIPSNPSAIRSQEEFRFAASQTLTFARSQFQVAIYSEGATGRQLTAIEVADAFGVKFLATVISEGAAPLPETKNAAGDLIRKRREQLGIGSSDLASRLNINSGDLTSIEAGKSQAPIRILESACRALNLDERRIGVSSDLVEINPNLRLRYFSREKGDEHNFSTDLVFSISDIFWVFRKSESLRVLNSYADNKNFDRFDRNLALLDDPLSQNYIYPTWQKGELLADHARERLDISPNEPRFNLCSLLKNKLKLIVLPVDWPEEYAGATLSVGGARAVAINFKGMNRRENTLRFTLAHELGHILCDNDDRLDHLKVSKIRDKDSKEKSMAHDLPELRANSFAAAFLMPKKDLENFVHSSSQSGDDLKTISGKVQTRYGVSASAARWRLKGLGLEVEGQNPQFQNVDSRDGDEVKEMEIDATAPLSRNGAYLSLLKIARENNLITSDTFDVDSSSPL